MIGYMSARMITLKEVIFIVYVIKMMILNFW